MGDRLQDFGPVTVIPLCHSILRENNNQMVMQIFPEIKGKISSGIRLCGIGIARQRWVCTAFVAHIDGIDTENASEYFPTNR
jgi:hypothetical protein